MKMSSFFAAFLVILSLFYGVYICNATEAQLCSCRCGTHNISLPFRLQDSPDNCGNVSYNLYCENNHLMLFLGFGKYYVKSINYNNYTIRVVDVNVGAGTHDYSSLPRYSLGYYNFSYDEPYQVYQDWIGYEGMLNSWVMLDRKSLVKVMLYLWCPNRVDSADLYVGDINASCSYAIGSSFYVNVDGKSLWDLGLGDSCSVELMYLTSWLNEITH